MTRARRARRQHSAPLAPAPEFRRSQRLASPADCLNWYGIGASSANTGRHRQRARPRHRGHPGHTAELTEWLTEHYSDLHAHCASRCGVGALRSDPKRQRRRRAAIDFLTGRVPPVIRQMGDPLALAASGRQLCDHARTGRHHVTEPRRAAGEKHSPYGVRAPSLVRPNPSSASPVATDLRGAPGAP